MDISWMQSNVFCPFNQPTEHLSALQSEGWN